MASSSAQQNIFNRTKPFRVGGSGFTSFWWNGHVIGFAQQVSHQAPQPVATPVAIQPLDQQYPLQIITPAAIGAGTLQVQLFEMYGQKVWDQIMKITDTGGFGTAGQRSNARYNDLSEVFLRLSALNKPVNASKIIYPPNTGVRGGPKVKHYAELYHNVVITDIRDDEQIEIGTMEVIKTMTVMYTYMTREQETH
jgi:hypothetical protein